MYLWDMYTHHICEQVLLKDISQNMFLEITCNQNRYSISYDSLFWIFMEYTHAIGCDQ